MLFHIRLSGESSVRSSVVVRRGRGLAIPTEPFPKQGLQWWYWVDDDLPKVSGFDGLRRRSYPSDVLFIPLSPTSLSFVSPDRPIEGVCEVVDTGSRKAFTSYRG